MGAIWKAVRGVRGVISALRFRVWILELRLQLRRCGAALIVDAPHGLLLKERPELRVFTSNPRAGGTTTLRFDRDARIGRGCRLEIDSSGDNLLSLGEKAELLNNVRLLLRSGSVSIGSECLVRDTVWIKSDGQFTMEDRVIIGPESAIHCSESIRFEELAGTGERVSFIDSDHTFDGTDEHYMKKPITTEPVVIGRGTMVAVGSVVLRGATIGANSVVAANSVVRGETYPPASLIAGNPARLVRTLADRIED